MRDPELEEFSAALRRSPDDEGESLRKLMLRDPLVLLLQDNGFMDAAGRIVMYGVRMSIAEETLRRLRGNPA